MSRSAQPELRFVAATANAHKVREMTAILTVALPQLVLLQRPSHIGDIEEDADTLVGNARLKAVVIARACRSAAIADDSGLFVDALGGAPGVQSARYAGVGASDAQNRTRVLDMLDGCNERGARFTSVAFVAWPNGDELWCEGSIEGRITDRERGSNGFGYDSIFVPSDHNDAERTYAQYSASEKDADSHRSRAFRRLAEALRVRMHGRPVDR